MKMGKWDADMKHEILNSKLSDRQILHQKSKGVQNDPCGFHKDHFETTTSL